MIKKMLVALGLATVATAGLADVASPFPLTNTRYGPAGTKGRAVVAARGSDFLVAVQTLTDVRVTRLVRAPLPTPPLPVPVLTNYSDRSGGPALVATAGGYFLAGSRNGNVIGRFLDPAGQPVSAELAVATGGTAPRVAVAANGRLLVLYTYGTLGRVRAALLDENGHPLSDAEVYSTGTFFSPVSLRYDVATSGADFLAVVSGYSGVRAYRISLSGAVSSETVIDSDAPPDHVAAGSDGHGYVVLWGRAAKGTLLTTWLSGTAPPTPSWTIAETADKRPVTFPSLTWSGTEYLVTYTTRGTYLGRLRNDGSPLSTPQALSETPTDTGWSSVAASADGALAVWSLGDPLLADPLSEPTASLGGIVYGRYVAGGSPAGTPFVVLNAAPEETKLAAAGAAGLLVTWVDVTAERQAVMAGIEGAEGSWNELGELLRSTDVPIANLLVTTDGANYLLIVTMAGQSSAIRVASSGVVLTRQPIVLPMAVTGATWTGSSFALVGVEQANLIGMLLGPAGEVVRVPFALRQPRELEAVNRPAVASDGTNVLVAWNNSSPCTLPITCGPSYNVAARRFSSQLAPVDTTELNLSPTAADAVAAIAWNGAQYLVAWNNGSALNARRVTPSGLLPDPSPLTLATRSSDGFTPPSVAANGSRFGVAYRTKHFSVRYEPESSYLSFVEGDGNVGSPISYDLNTLGTAAPVMTSAGGSFALASTVIAAPEPYHGSERIFLRWLDSTPAPAAPELLKAEIANGRVALQWSTVAGASGYRFEYKIGDAPWKEADRFFPSSTNAVDVGGIKAGFPYRFRIRAWSRGGVSPYSNERSATLPPRPRTAAAR